MSRGAMPLLHQVTPKEVAIMSVRPLVRASVVLTSVLALLAINPRPSGAIRLAWKSGETDLSFTEARSCTLFVQAEPGSVLPVEWRLVWVAANDSGQTPFY